MIKWTLAELVGTLSEERKKEFNAADYVEERAANVQLVAVLDAEGKPKYYVGKDGKTKIKKKRVAIGDEKVEFFNLMKAKRAFYDAYKDDFEWTSKPKEAKAKAKNDATTNALASLGITLKK